MRYLTEKQRTDIAAQDAKSWRFCTGCLGIALILMIPVAIVMWVGYAASWPFAEDTKEQSAKAAKGHASDEVLAHNFLAHEAAFEHLRQMFGEDRARYDGISVRLAEIEYFILANGKSELLESRKKEYIKAMQALGLENGTQYKDRPLMLTTTSWGFLLAGGSNKGYIYSTNKPVDKREQRDEIRYQHIKGHWYVFEENAW